MGGKGEGRGKWIEWKVNGFPFGMHEWEMGAGSNWRYSFSSFDESHTTTTRNNSSRYEILDNSQLDANRARYPNFIKVHSIL